MRHDGGLDGAQKILLFFARHLDVGQVDTKVTASQTPISHRAPHSCFNGFVEFHRSNVNWKHGAPAFPVDMP
jgi:hypothetical protein